MPTYEYIDNMLEERRTLSSALHVLETSDPNRYEEVVAAATGDARLLLRRCPDCSGTGSTKERKCSTCNGTGFKDFDHKVVWDLQTGQILTPLPDHEEPDPALVANPAELKSQEQKLTDCLTTSQTLLLIKWVFSRVPMDALNNWLLYWSQNRAIKARWSYIILFTWSLNHISPEVLRWSTSYKIPTSTDSERKYILEEFANQVFKSQQISTGNGRTKADSPVFREPKKLDVADEIWKNATRGMTGHDVLTAARRSYARTKNLKYEIFSEYKVKNILSAFNIRYIEPKLSFNDVAGFQYFKNYVREEILDPLIHKDEYLAEGIAAPKGMMVYGPPGVGKTYLAYAIGAESGLSVVHLSSPDFLSKYVGESEQRTRQIAEIIESLAPVVVFWDECDAILADRSTANPALDSGVRANVGSGLLEWIGSPDRQAFVVGATNYIERIDKAFLRKGRFDVSALLLYPDTASRVELLKLYSKEKKLTDGFDFGGIAERTAMWNCAELADLPNTASKIRRKQGKKFLDEPCFVEAIEKRYMVDTLKRKEELKKYLDTYRKWTPNFDPYLLEEAKKSFQNDSGDIYKSFMEGV